MDDGDPAQVEEVLAGAAVAARRPCQCPTWARACSTRRVRVASRGRPGCAGGGAARPAAPRRDGWTRCARCCWRCTVPAAGRRRRCRREAHGPAGLERHAHPGRAGQLPGGEVEGELVLGEPAAGVAYPPGLAEDRQVRAAVADQGRGQVGPVDVQLGQVPPGSVQVGYDIAGDLASGALAGVMPTAGTRPVSRSRMTCRL